MVTMDPGKTGSMTIQYRFIHRHRSIVFEVLKAEELSIEYNKIGLF